MIDVTNCSFAVLAMMSLAGLYEEDNTNIDMGFATLKGCGVVAACSSVLDSSVYS
jgi:hypothetical protein